MTVVKIPEIAIMVEGQNGLNWPRWQKLALAVEALGFAGLYRSDHYTNAVPPDLDSLELWVSLGWLASHTSRIDFGPLVSPVSFRHPTQTARMAAALDDLSEGRFVLGLGAGWQEREHHNYGWDLLGVPARFERFKEGLEVITRLFSSDQPVSYPGKYFQLEDAILLPRPQRPGGPPILVGGNGEQRTLPLVARYASEWNAVYITAAEFTRLNARLDELMIELGRQPGEVKRSMMTGCVFGRDTNDVAEKVASRTQNKRSPQQLREHGVILGSAPEMQEQLAQLAEVGVHRVMLQWLDLDDLDGLAVMAKGLLG
jgi:F420-dependent oxidoreductase-like protein